MWGGNLIERRVRFMVQNFNGNSSMFLMAMTTTNGVLNNYRDCLLSTSDSSWIESGKLEWRIKSLSWWMKFIESSNWVNNHCYWRLRERMLWSLSNLQFSFISRFTLAARDSLNKWRWFQIVWIDRNHEALRIKLISYSMTLSWYCSWNSHRLSGYKFLIVGTLDRS